MLLTRSSLLLSVLLLGACDSKITSTVDARFSTLKDCFPDLFQKLKGLLAVADTWRLKNGSVPDPTGLSVVEQSNTLVATLLFDGCTLVAVISFYDPNGNLQDLDLTSATTLGDKVDLAATQLRNAFQTGDPFMVGDWTLTGPGIAGSGALTGIIGGSTNQNELEELRTTTAAPAGGPPPNATSTITDNGPPVCTLTFNTTSLLTDTVPTQQYPIGTINLTIAGATTVTAAITFDATNIARIVVTGTTGRFDFNVDTRSLTYVP